MKDMKMSECFSMPVRGEYERDYCDEYHYNIYDNSGDVLLPCLPEDVDHEAIVEAINNHDRLQQENEELREALSNLIWDCDKVITNLTNTGCDEAWSIIKLNNMIADCKLHISPTCQGCDGDGDVTDTFDVVWPCPECHGSGKMLIRND